MYQRFGGLLLDTVRWAIKTRSARPVDRYERRPRTLCKSCWRQQPDMDVCHAMTSSERCGPALSTSAEDVLVLVRLFNFLFLLGFWLFSFVLPVCSDVSTFEFWQRSWLIPNISTGVLQAWRHYAKNWVTIPFLDQVHNLVTQPIST